MVWTEIFYLGEKDRQAYKNRIIDWHNFLEWNPQANEICLRQLLDPMSFHIHYGKMFPFHSTFYIKERIYLPVKYAVSSKTNIFHLCKVAENSLTYSHRVKTHITNALVKIYLVAL